MEKKNYSHSIFIWGNLKLQFILLVQLHSVIQLGIFQQSWFDLTSLLWYSLNCWKMPIERGSALLLSGLYLRHSFFHFLLWKMSVLSNYLRPLKYLFLAYPRVPGNLQLWCMAFIISETIDRHSPWVFSGIGLSMGVLLGSDTKAEACNQIISKRMGSPQH